MQPVATLTDELEEIRYRHAEDGQWYSHKFAPGASIVLMPDGTASVEREDGKPVWMDDTNLDEWRSDVHFLDNPRKRGSRLTRPKRRSRSKGMPRTVTRHHRVSGESKPMARTRKRRKASAGPTRRRRQHLVRAHTSNPRRRRRRVSSVGRRRPSTRARRRTYRRNPRLLSTGWLMECVKDGAGVVVGQVATRKATGLVRQYVPGMSATSGPLAAVGPILGATVTAIVARRFGGKFSRSIAAGAFAEAIEGALQATPLAGIVSGGSSGALSAWPGAGNLQLTAGPVGVRAWPARSRSMAREVGGGNG